MESRDVARAALGMAMTPSREEETALKQRLQAEGIKSTAVDYGGEFIGSLQKVVERAVIASKREQLIDQTHHAEEAVLGATREALVQIMPKALGLNVGRQGGDRPQRPSHCCDHLIRHRAAALKRCGRRPGTPGDLAQKGTK